MVNTILISHRYQRFSGVERPQAKLGKSDVKLVLAGRQSEIGTSFQRIGEPVENVSELNFPTMRQVINALRAFDQPDCMKDAPSIQAIFNLTKRIF